MLEKTKQYIQKPIISPLTLIFLMFNLALDVAQSATIAEGLGKIFLTLGLILSGARLTDVKELLLRMKAVLQDPKKNLQQKINDILSIVVTGCATIGALQVQANEYPIKDFVRKVDENPTGGKPL